MDDSRLRIIFPGGVVSLNSFNCNTNVDRRYYMTMTGQNLSQVTFILFQRYFNV